MALTEAQKKANKKWNKENLESVQVWLKKGTKAGWKAAAEQMGVSLASLISTAVDEKMAREGVQIPATDPGDQLDPQGQDGGSG